jgi:hypothetical protein
MGTLLLTQLVSPQDPPLLSPAQRQAFFAAMAVKFGPSFVSSVVPALPLPMQGVSLAEFLIELGEVEDSRAIRLVLERWGFVDGEQELEEKAAELIKGVMSLVVEGRGSVDGHAFIRALASFVSSLPYPCLSVSKISSSRARLVGSRICPLGRHRRLLRLGGVSPPSPLPPRLPPIPRASSKPPSEPFSSYRRSPLRLVESTTAARPCRPSPFAPLRHLQLLLLRLAEQGHSERDCSGRAAGDHREHVELSGGV